VADPYLAAAAGWVSDAGKTVSTHTLKSLNPLTGGNWCVNDSAVLTLTLCPTGPFSVKTSGRIDFSGPANCTVTAS